MDKKPGFRISLSTFAAITVILIAFFTYFKGYDQPAKLFWDENYHIASAQKYLHEVHFLELHPPLGKMLLALGEKILRPNAASDQFLTIMHIPHETLPEGFSVAGYRLIPAFLGWMTALIVFLIFLEITKSSILSLLLSSLYLFDNALIVHSRGAMLEAPHLFFILLTILCVLKLRVLNDNGARRFLLWSALCGVSFACVMTIKVTGLILILLAPFLLFNLKNTPKRIFYFLLTSIPFFLATYVSIWCLHFSIAKKVIVNLENNGYFVDDFEYRRIIDEGSYLSPASFYKLWKTQQFDYIQKYNAGVPKLNLCSGEEKGSPSYFWPIGARSINYRWEKADNNEYRYLYLQSNPVIWFGALLGVITAASLSIASILVPLALPLKNRGLIFTFLALYFGYLVGVSIPGRVMYLYHYFIPLIFAYILLALVIVEISKMFSFSVGHPVKILISTIFAALSFWSFRLYSPLTYYKPISASQLRSLAIIPLWDLGCEACSPGDAPHVDLQMHHSHTVASSHLLTYKE